MTWLLLGDHNRGATHGSDHTIGLDIAKSVFQVHGVDAQGKVVVRRQLKRRQVLPFFEKLPPCLVGHGGVRNARIIGRGSCRGSATPCG